MDYIKIDAQVVELGGVNWFDPAQDRGRWWDVVNAVMNVWVP
jgi:hypothetical protein